MELSAEQMTQLKAQLSEILEQVVRDGEERYKDFTPRINAAVDRGRLGEGFLYNLMPHLGESAADLAYAVATNDELCDYLDGLPREEALAFINRHKDDILESIDFDSMNMDHWVKVSDQHRNRKKRGEGLFADETDRFMAERQKPRR